jgi:hypothetical protein
MGAQDMMVHLGVHHSGKRNVLVRPAIGRQMTLAFADEMQLS